MSETLFEVRDLKKYFPMKQKTVLKAVDGISFAIKEGETLGLVGESGCGKTTAGRTAVGLLNRTAGDAFFRGQNIHELRGAARKAYFKEVQTIFQDPYASLNPRKRVLDIIAEGIDIHHLAASRQERLEMVGTLLNQVGLSREHASRYVHEFSGGQRQRIGIARALAVNPSFILCDEPISALDVSIQAQIVNLLEQLQEERGLTYLFIAHDLTMVKHISTRIAVMYLGKIVEISPSDRMYEAPLHPYTRALLSAIPIPDPDVERGRGRTRLQGDVPSPTNLPPGCRFAGRCPFAKDICRKRQPELLEAEPGHLVACHLYFDKGGGSNQ